jgi:transcription initiation factor TFIIH subunit 2
MQPTRFNLMLEYACEFVTGWFDQNPLGQIGIVGIRDIGSGVSVIKSVIPEQLVLEPVSKSILQNVIEMAHSMHFPSPLSSLI